MAALPLITGSDLVRLTAYLSLSCWPTASHMWVKHVLLSLGELYFSHNVSMAYI